MTVSITVVGRWFGRSLAEIVSTSISVWVSVSSISVWVSGVSISVPWLSFCFWFGISYGSGFGFSIGGTLSTVSTISITTITVSTAISITIVGIGLRLCRDDGNNESYENS